MDEVKKVNKDQAITVVWSSDGAAAQLCQIISVLALLAVIVRFIMGVIHTLSGGPEWGVLAFLIFAAVLFKWLGSELSVKRIVMNKQRINFSLCYTFDLFGRLSRKWTDIGAIALQDEEFDTLPGDDEERRQLVFHFSSGGTVKVPLRQILVSDLDALLEPANAGAVLRLWPLN